MNPFSFFEPERWAPRSGETAFEYWASLTPAAPLFGVPWRFADAPRPVPATARTARPAPAPVRMPETAPVAANPAPAEPPVEPEPVAEPGAPAGAAAVKPWNLLATPPAECDDLKKIKGVGPKLEKELNALGIYRLDQIAAFGPAQTAWLSENLSAFRDRPVRDNWAAQARALLGD